MRSLPHLLVGFLALSCGNGAAPQNPTVVPGAGAHEGGSTEGASLPLQIVSDVDLPGGATRFDYQDVDLDNHRLVIAHMNDAAVVVVDTTNGAVLKVLSNIPTARGVVVAKEVGKIFVTSAPDQLVVIDAQSLTEITRVKTGRSPDGVAWDPVHRIVSVSDQRDGAVSLIADGGSGGRVQVALGKETGNVVFDAKRSTFWTAVVGAGPVDTIVELDPVAGKELRSIAVPGCEGAHGLRLHPDGASAFVACEGNDRIARVGLDGPADVALEKTGVGPDVLAIDPTLGWLYVAAESGDLVVIDIRQPGLVVKSREHPGDNAHTVAVDPTTHRVFFPLMAGPAKKPLLRIMRPGGL